MLKEIHFVVAWQLACAASHFNIPSMPSETVWKWIKGFGSVGVTKKHMKFAEVHK